MNINKLNELISHITSKKLILSFIVMAIDYFDEEKYT